MTGEGELTMPQATEEQRAEWGVAPDKAMNFLEGAGFVLNRDWTWGRVAAPNEEEGRAIAFLCDEWDFGGFVRSTS